MRKIAIILVLLQLIGCTQQRSSITRADKTHQGEDPQLPITNYSFMQLAVYMVGGLIGFIALGELIVYVSGGFLLFTDWCTGKGAEEPSDEYEYEEED